MWVQRDLSDRGHHTIVHNKDSCAHTHCGTHPSSQVAQPTARRWLQAGRSWLPCSTYLYWDFHLFHDKQGNLLGGAPSTSPLTCCLQPDAFPPLPLKGHGCIFHLVIISKAKMVQITWAWAQTYNSSPRIPTVHHPAQPWVSLLAISSACIPARHTFRARHIKAHIT